MLLRQRSFFAIVGLLVFLDSVLLASPNLLGRIGLLIYKYHYLRTFPRALLTVSVVCVIFVLVTFLIQLLVTRQVIKKVWGFIPLSLLLCFVIYIYSKLVVDFSSWSYSHTGWRFKSGAYLLPLIVMYIVVHTMYVVGKFKSHEKEIKSMAEDISSANELSSPPE